MERALDKDFVRPCKVMVRLLIVCMGNPLRGDDGFARQIANQLCRQSLPVGIQLIAVQQLMPEVSELASQAESVLFVDAAHKGVPGTMICKRIAPAFEGLESHRLSPEGILALAQSLYGRFPTAHLLTIVGASFGDGEELSPVVADRLPAALVAICEFIHKIKSGEEDEP